MLKKFQYKGHSVCAKYFYKYALSAARLAYTTESLVYIKLIEDYLSGNQSLKEKLLNKTVLSELNINERQRQNLLDAKNNSAKFNVILYSIHESLVKLLTERTGSKFLENLDRILNIQVSIKQEKFRTSLLSFIVDQNKKTEESLYEACLGLAEVATYTMDSITNEELGSDEVLTPLSNIVNNAIKDIEISRETEEKLRALQNKFFNRSKKCQNIGVDSCIEAVITYFDPDQTQITQSPSHPGSQLTSSEKKSESRIITETHENILKAIYPIEIDGYRLKKTGYESAGNCALKISGNLTVATNKYFDALGQENSLTTDLKQSNSENGEGNSIKAKQNLEIACKESQKDLEDSSLVQHRGTKAAFYKFLSITASIIPGVNLVFWAYRAGRVSQGQSFFPKPKTKSALDIENGVQHIRRLSCGG